MRPEVSSPILVHAARRRVWKRKERYMDFIGRLVGRLRHEDGATMVEYGLMVALIAVIALGAVAAVGGGVTNIFCTIAGSLGGAGC
jgi:pilus assembly protein Flp/PilA